MDAPPRMDRRTALKWMLAAAATTALAPRFARGQTGVPAAKGYGADPDVMKHYQPGELWPLTFTDAQRRTAAALCDIIIPAAAEAPAPSTGGRGGFLDEWSSAPYPVQLASQGIVRP